MNFSCMFSQFYSSNVQQESLYPWSGSLTISLTIIKILKMDFQQFQQTDFCVNTEKKNSAMQRVMSLPNAGCLWQQQGSWHLEVARCWRRQQEGPGFWWFLEEDMSWTGRQSGRKEWLMAAMQKLVVQLQDWCDELMSKRKRYFYHKENADTHTHSVSLYLFHIHTDTPNTITHTH